MPLNVLKEHDFVAALFAEECEEGENESRCNDELAQVITE